MKNHRVCDASHPMAKDHRLVRSTQPHWPFQLTNWFRVTGHLHAPMWRSVHLSSESFSLWRLQRETTSYPLGLMMFWLLLSQTTDTLTPCFPLNLFTPGLIVVNKALRAIADLLMSMPFKVLSFPFHFFNSSVMFHLNINFDSDVSPKIPWEEQK